MRYCYNHDESQNLIVAKNCLGIVSPMLVFYEEISGPLFPRRVIIILAGIVMIAKKMALKKAGCQFIGYYGLSQKSKWQRAFMMRGLPCGPGRTVQPGPQGKPLKNEVINQIFSRRPISALRATCPR